MIGKGGTVIRALIEETGTWIDITDEDIVTTARVSAWRVLKKTASA